MGSMAGMATTEYMESLGPTAFTVRTAFTVFTEFMVNMGLTDMDPTVSPLAESI